MQIQTGAAPIKLTNNFSVKMYFTCLITKYLNFQIDFLLLRCEFGISFVMNRFVIYFGPFSIDISESHEHWLKHHKDFTAESKAEMNRAKATPYLICEICKNEIEITEFVPCMPAKGSVEELDRYRLIIKCHSCYEKK